ncbi:MAG: type II toxin-antitoxin system PemK/MazF family toxin [Bauldia sp.]
MICSFADVVVVPFPFVDRPISKTRPALVFSSAAFNEEHDQSVLAMITTGANSAWPSDIVIGDGKRAGLARRSVIRWKLFTLPNQIILKRIGTLGEKDLAAVKRSARRYFLQ